MSFPPIETLIPHTGPMVLLDEMCAWDEDGAVCSLEVREGAPFVVDGMLPSHCLIEHMAQSVAACLGHGAYLGGQGVRVGMLIGCRSFEALVAEIPAGHRLRVQSRKVRGSESVSQFRCEVEDETSACAVATAVLTLFHAEKAPA